VTERFQETAHPPSDLAIIGGGPAGTAAALSARQHGLRVAIWERDRFPRDKVCGEFLSWEAVPLLQEQIPETLARAAVIRSTEFISPHSRVYAFTLPGEARGLSRWALDQALWCAVRRSGADAYEDEAVRVSPRSGRKSAGWQIETARRQIFSARALLVACGRWWLLKGFPSPARNSAAGTAGSSVGVKAHFSGLASRDVVEMYFFRGGYCGVAPVEDALYNVCCLFHRSLVQGLRGARLADLGKWLGLATHLEALQGRLHGATQVSETLATAPVLPAQRRSDDLGALLAGDAAGFLDPFTGDGISVALHTGRVAAEIVALSGRREPLNPGLASFDHAREYYRRRAAVRRSFRVATLLRVLLRAPESIQESAAVLLSNFAPRLLSGTRWREAAGGPFQ